MLMSSTGDAEVTEGLRDVLVCHRHRLVDLAVQVEDFGRPDRGLDILVDGLQSLGDGGGDGLAGVVDFVEFLGQRSARCWP